MVSDVKLLEYKEKSTRKKVEYVLDGDETIWAPIVYSPNGFSWVC